MKYAFTCSSSAGHLGSDKYLIGWPYPLDESNPSDKVDWFTNVQPHDMSLGKEFFLRGEILIRCFHGGPLLLLRWRERDDARGGLYSTGDSLPEGVRSHPATTILYGKYGAPNLPVVGWRIFLDCGIFYKAVYH